uniref:Interferon stimulated exonuclease gene 20-like 2 n=1 Tax=Cyprinus carpio TaxID=7962 RepID=A0A8C2A9M3_CYPCA
MSGLMLNLVCEPSRGGKSGESRGNAKHERFLGRRHYLETCRKNKNKPRNTQLNGGDQSKPAAIFPKFTSYLPNKTNEPSSSAQTFSRKSTFSFPSQRHPTHQAAPPTLGPLKYVALDCEMVGTGPKGCDLIYDKYIKPINPVTDFRSRWSGIRRQDLLHAIPFDQAQKEIVKIITGKVVVGHAIHNDFKVLKYFHPACQTRDTAQIPLLNQKAGLPVNEMVSLKRLTEAIFKKDIQTGKGGHSSVEDAKATMELFKVVESMGAKTLSSHYAWV